MKLTSFLIVISIVSAFATKTYSQSQNFSLRIENSTIKDILSKIEDQSDYYFMYSGKVIDVDRRVSININNKNISDILKTLFADTDISYTIKDRMIILKPQDDSNDVLGTQNQIAVSGKVTDSSGAPLPGVTVVIEGTTVGTITDKDGNYTLTKVPENGVLQFSFIGMTTQKISVDGRTVVNVKLAEETIGLDEVVAIGYGTQRKKDVTGSIGSVSQDDFKQQQITDVDQILQGRSAGVTVTKASGAPGGAARIRIRGSNSINGSNEPLYVIDGFVGGDFGAIDPNDIQDIQILKDASATAIYGSRGANGVVLVTTKTGTKGTDKLSFEATYSLSQNIKFWDMLNASQYIEVANAKAEALGASPVFTADQIDYFKTHQGTDWQNEVFRIANGQDFGINYSGGTDKTTYFVSGNYVNQDGIVINSNYKKFGIRTNVTSNITSKLKASVKTSFTRRESQNVGGGGGRTILSEMIVWAPTTPARDEQGNITIKDPVGATFESPLELAGNDHLSTNNVFNANGGITYSIIPGLTYDVTVGAAISNSNSKNFTQGLLQGTPNAAQSNAENVFLQLTNMLTYKKVFGDNHRIEATAVTEQQKSKYNSFGITVDNPTFPSLKYNNLSLVENTTGNAYTAESKINSFIGRINYQFMNRYMLTASVRTDGSSKFRGNNVYSTFPSVALGWDVAQESFLKDGFFDALKLRGSWGKTGSQAIGTYGTVSSFDLSTRGAATSFENGTSTPGAILSNPGNPDLKWETTDQTDIGVDMAFLKRRISFTADAYKKNTHDLLVQVPLPSYVGGGFRYQNVGEVMNKGFEFSIDATIIQKDDLSWTSSFNASFLKNEVVTLGETDHILINSVASTQTGIIKPGYSLATFFGLTYLGTWKAGQEAEAAVYGAVPGDARYLDRQAEGEEGYGVINSDDAGPIGNGMPKGVYGWNNTLKYKRFTFNVFMQAMSGFSRLDLNYAIMIGAHSTKNPTHADILGRWDAQANPNSDIPHFSSTDKEYPTSSRFVEKADYIRLKNISASYRLPFLGGHDITFMLSANNLFTISGYKGLDPEAYSVNGEYGGSDLGSQDTQGLDEGAYPNSRMYNFSVKINL